MGSGIIIAEEGVSPETVTLHSLDARLERIEALLERLTPLADALASLKDSPLAAMLPPGVLGDGG